MCIATNHSFTIKYVCISVCAVPRRRVIGTSTLHSGFPKMEDLAILTRDFCAYFFFPLVHQTKTGIVPWSILEPIPSTFSIHTLQNLTSVPHNPCSWIIVKRTKLSFVNLRETFRRPWGCCNVCREIRNAVCNLEVSLFRYKWVQVTCLTIDEVWIGEWIYWSVIHTTRNYKQL
jgi:hypothetical protein